MIIIFNLYYHSCTFRENLENWAFKKIQKGDITSGIRAWYWHIIVLKRIQINKPPPLDPEVEGAFVRGEEVVEEEVHFAKTMTSEGNGYTLHDKVEYIKI